MKTRRELAQEQLRLQTIIQDKANINIVNCGHCGTILLHERKPISEPNHVITCFSCKREMDLSDCPDLWYEGCIENAEFDENDEEIDLFENIDLLPIEVQNIINKYSEMDSSYENCANLVLELNSVGYTCDYGLDAVPYYLKKME